MKITEMLAKNPNRSPHSPEGLFEVTTPSGEKRLMCLAHFQPGLIGDLLEAYPDLPECEVTKESFTMEEWDQWLVDNRVIGRIVLP